MNGDGDTGLTESQRALVSRVRAARQRGAELEAAGRSSLAPEKQEFPIGIREDGTLNEEDAPE
jgi:hypothetical protein